MLEIAECVYCSIDPIVDEPGVVRHIVWNKAIEGWMSIPTDGLSKSKTETPEAKKEREELELINEVSDMLNTNGVT